MKQFFITALLLSGALSLAAADAGAKVSFVRDVAPILTAKCVGCHNASKARGGYQLHTFEALLKPGDSAEPPVSAGDAAKSHLYQLLITNNEDDRMPQKDEPLSARQVATIRDWIDQGAKFDGPRATELLVVLTAPRHLPAPPVYPRAVPITALAFDASGETLATGGHHEIVLWNWRDSTVRQRIRGVAEKTFALAFSGDGRWLAAGSGTPGRVGEVRLFNATNGELSAVLSTVPDSALCVAFSPDGTKLAAGGADNVIRIWDLNDLKLKLTIEQHADWVLDLAFSADGQRLASASRDKSARIFHSRTGELEETYTGHADFVVGVAWAGPKAIASVPRTGAGHRWNTGNTRRQGEFSGWQGEPTQVASSSNHLFVATMDGQVRHYTSASNQFVRALRGADAIQSLALDRAAKRIAAGAHDGEVRVWRVADGELLGRFVAAPGLPARHSQLR